MQENVLVSIIIPSRNKGEYIYEAVSSALNQSWKDVEVLVVDDNSSDNSREILDRFKDARLQVYHKEFNNASAARNFGLHKATGKFIQFLDADDLLHLSKIEKQLQDMNFNEDCLGVCNTKSFLTATDDEREEIDTEFLRNQPEPILFLKKMYADPDAGMVQPNAWLTPRKLIDKSGYWNEDLSLDDDGEFFCRVILAAKIIVHTDEILNYYRKILSDGNISSDKSCKGFKSMLQAAILKKKFLEHYIKDNKLSEDFSAIYNVLLARVMVNAYPWCKGISNAAAQKLIKSAPVVLPVLGGRMVEKIKKIIGWRLTKRMQLLKNSFTKNYRDN